VIAGPRILIAGIGNIFLGDDAFGVEVARLLLGRPQPAGVRVVDFGIRGLDLAYTLTDNYDAAILVDAAPRGGTPGTLYLIEPSLDQACFAASAGFDGHSMDPVKVLQLASTLGTLPPRVLVVGCEPGSAAADDNETFELSPPVQAALGPAVEMVESLIGRLLSEESIVPMQEMAE
jgi:hydrogenase maturation protease